MDNYDKNQFKKMKERYTKNLEISDWNELYARMRDDFSVLNDNDLEREKIRTETIVECAKQYKVNIGLDYGLTIATLAFSVVATIISIFIEQSPEIEVWRWIGCAFILTVFVRAIICVVIQCANFCHRRRDDLIYYQMQLSIINSILAERQSKAN